jgi:hypothetical protein
MFKSTINTKFLGMKINKNLKWKNLIDQILPKLGAACCTGRLLHTRTHRCSEDGAIAYFHSIIKYGIIFWGNSTTLFRAFTSQKRIIRSMCGVAATSPCRNLF